MAPGGQNNRTIALAQQECYTTLGIVSETTISDTQFFRDVFDASPIGIAVENMEGRPLFANAALCSMLGFTEEEMQSKHCVQFSPPEDASKDWDLFQQLRAGTLDHYQIDKRYFRRDGSVFWGSLSVSMLRSQPSPLVVAMVEDITEKRLAEESQRTHSAIVGASDDAIISATMDGIILSWNPGAQHMFGYTEAEAVGKSVRMLVPLELPEQEDKILAALRTGGRIQDLETVRITKTGKRIDVSLKISPIKDSAGNAVAISGILRDISDRKRAEGRLREYEKAVEGLDEMVVVVDRDYRYLIANRKFLNARNMSKEQVEGRTAKDVLNHGVFEAVVKEKLDQCFQGQVVRFEMKYSYPDTGERDVLVSYFPIEGPGGIDRVACIIQDITERKKAGEALRESEERFRLAAEAGKMYAYEWDVESDVLVRSQEYKSVLGESEPRRFTRLQFLEKIHPEDRAAFLSAIDGLTPETPNADITYRVLMAGGSVLWLKNSGRAFFDENGKMQRVIGMVSDVTDYKLAEEAVANMTRKLIDAQEVERSRIARELHDNINQRLALLAVEIEASRQEPPDSTNAVGQLLSEMQKHISDISSEVQSMSHQLYSSQLEYLGLVPAMRSFCRELAQRQKVEIDFSYNEIPASVPHETSLCLFRVLQEALHNASKHSRVRHFGARLDYSPNELRLTVSDQGAGFDLTIAANNGGIGLISMRERVRSVNGSIAVDSKPMGGTTISVRVPLGSDDVAELAAG